MRTQPTRWALTLVVMAMLLASGLPAVFPDGAEGPADPRPGPVGLGEGLEPMSITPDPYVDRFTALLPWPTNRTIYGIYWRPGGNYALAVGSSGALYKVTATAFTRIETGTEQSIYDVAWKADGSQALLVGNHSAMFTWDASSDDLAEVAVPYDQRFLGATWDPTGAVAMVVGDGGFVGRYNGTAVTSLFTGLADFIYRVRWMPGGDHALAVGDNGLLMRINTTEVMNTTRANANWGLWRVDWAPDGSYALIAGKTFEGIPQALVVKYLPDGSTSTVTVPGSPAAGLRAVDFAPTGERAVLAGENSTVLRWAGTALTSLMAPGDRTLRAATWEGDSNTLMVSGNRGVVLRYDGAWSNVSYDPRIYLSSVAWRPQGDYGLVVGRSGHISRVSMVGGRDLSYDTTEDLYDVDWASDGTYALICGGGGTVLRYDHGGSEAESIKPVLAVQDLHGISIRPGADMALVVGDNGNVWHWANGLWTDKKPTGLNRNLRDVAWRPDGEFAIIVGVSAALYNYTGGLVKSFSPQPQVLAAPFFSVAWDKDGDRALVVGGREPNEVHDTIWAYDNRNWGPINSNTGRAFYGCAFTADGEVGLAFGDPDVIVKFSTRTWEGIRSNFKSPYTLVQRANMHPSGRSVYFVGSRGYCYKMDVGQFVNNPPIARIAAPATGATFDVGVPLEFSANGSWDADDDQLTYTWVSNVSGVLGVGKVVRAIVLDPGWHRLQLYVDDGHGHNVTEYIILRFVVPNYPPVPVIEAPLNGSTFTTEDVIVFNATGSIDPNGDPITYHWVSSLSGDIGYDERVESTLRVGQHRIILWVEDDKGERVHVFVDITVVQANRPPNVYITDPIENETFEVGEEIELNASYSNDPDGDALTLTWSSDLDGVLGQGVVVRLTTLSVGRHLLSVEADDGHGHAVSVSINVSVVEPVNLRPQISLSSPPSNTTVKGTVLVTGLAVDPEGEDLLVRYAFISPEDWAVATLSGSAWSFEWDTTAVENAQVAVYVEAYDGVNTRRLVAQYFVDNPEPVNAPPEASLVFPPEGRIDGQVILEGVASDPDGDLIERVEVQIDAGFWEEAVGGNAWTFWWDTATVPDGTHTVTVRAYDGQDWSEEVTYEFDVRNPDGDGNGGVSGATGMLIVLLGIIVLVVALAYVRLRAPRR